MSTAKFDTLSNLAGTQSVPVATVAQGVSRAWVSFNGTGTVAIRASFNVSSITDNGNGDYTVNFTTAMPDANYAVAGTATRDITNNYNYGHTWAPGTGAGYTTTSVRMFYNYYSGTTLYDVYVGSVAIFR